MTHLIEGGTWKEWSQRPIPSQKTLSYLIISSVALAIIGCGAALYFMHTNVLAGELLMGVGSFVAVTGILSFALCKKHHTYKVACWNLGASEDYPVLLRMKELVEKKNKVETAYEIVREERLKKLTTDEKETWKKNVKKKVAQFQSYDFICLQNLPSELKSTPPGFASLSFKNSECGVFWNSSKFEILKYAEIDYSDDHIGPDSRSDTLVLLQERATGVKICLASSSLRGFNLAAKDYQWFPRKGDYQARYNLATMAKVSADIYIFAGSLEATSDLYPERLKILEAAGYQAPLNGAPTKWEPIFKPARALKTDHIYVKGAMVHYEEPFDDLFDFDRPSDHMSLRATLTN